MSECRPVDRVGAALCSICAFLLTAPEQAPLIREAVISAGRVAVFTTPGGWPGDDRYEIEVRDAEARVLLPIVGHAARIVRRDGWEALA